MFVVGFYASMFVVGFYVSMFLLPDFLSRKSQRFPISNFEGISGKFGCGKWRKRSREKCPFII